MTIIETSGFAKDIASGKIDTGGNSMNIISKILVSPDYDDKKKFKAEAYRNVYDYGFTVYQSLEYGFKHLKSDDYGFRENLLKIIMR